MRRRSITLADALDGMHEICDAHAAGEVVVTNRALAEVTVRVHDHIAIISQSYRKHNGLRVQ